MLLIDLQQLIYIFNFDSKISYLIFNFTKVISWIYNCLLVQVSNCNQIKVMHHIGINSIFNSVRLWFLQIASNDTLFRSL